MLDILTDVGHAQFSFGSAAEEIDVRTGARLARGKDRPAVRLLGALSEVGDQPPLAFLSGAVLAYGVLAGDCRAKTAGMRMLASLALASGAKTALKRLVGRTRPNVLLEKGLYKIEPLGPDKGPWHSFPSGHSAGSVAVARALRRSYPQAGAPAYVAAGFVALIQVPRGAHYPADVVAGSLLGLLAEAIVASLAARPPRN